MSDLMKWQIQTLGHGNASQRVGRRRWCRFLPRSGSMGVLGIAIIVLNGCAAQAPESPDDGQATDFEQSTVSSDVGSGQPTKVETVFSFEKQSRERYGDERMDKLERGDDDSE